MQMKPMLCFEAGGLEGATVPGATVGDGFQDISVLPGGLSAFPAQAQGRGALCCLPATVHQEASKLVPCAQYGKVGSDCESSFQVRVT